MNIYKIVVFLLSLITIFLILCSFALFIPKYQKLKASEAALAKLENELAEKKAESLHLEEQLSGLTNDPDILEKFAREKYGYCREGEIIYTYNKEELSRLVGPVGIEPTTR